jgi:branched-subunit amino acid ABC-type transport system permease component
MLGVLSAYLSWYLYTTFNLNYILAGIIVSILVSFLYTLNWNYIYKPLRQKGGTNTSMILLTFAILIITQNLLSLFFNSTSKYIQIWENTTYVIGSLYITKNNILILVTALSLFLIFNFIVHKTKYGLAIRAIGQNQELAKINGINSEAIIKIVFFISAFLISMGVILNSLELGLRTGLGLIIILKIVIIAVIGGLGSQKGAIAGAFTLGLIENFTTYYIGQEWIEIISFTVLIIFLSVRPQGIFGQSNLRNF